MIMQYDVLLAGIGGQGIITLSEILATSAISRNLKAIVTQDRGLAQRGGSVKAHVRMGEVYSPMIPKHSAHALLSLEMNESFGYIDYLSSNTVLVISTKAIPSGESEKKPDGENRDKIEELGSFFGKNYLIVDAESEAKGRGIPRGANLFMLGILFGIDQRLASFLFEKDVTLAIRSVMKQSTEENVKIFKEGIRYARNRQ